LREVDLILKGQLERERRERRRSHELAELITLGFHNPKKFPKLEAFIGSSKPAKRDDPDGLHAFLLALSKKGK
jgi:hypothetical protein